MFSRHHILNSRQEINYAALIKGATVTENTGITKHIILVVM